MISARFVWGGVLALGLTACSSFDQDFQAYCQARGELTSGQACQPTSGCCQPFTCAGGRCCIALGQVCTENVECCSGAVCTMGKCAAAPARDGGDAWRFDGGE